MKQAHNHKARRYMPLKVLIIVLTATLSLLTATLALSAGCIVQQESGKQGGSGEGMRPMIYPSEGLNKFPQDQMIKKELQVTTRWPTVTFEKPLQINRRGTMGMHLVVDQGFNKQ
jgi:hypothetical protein